MAKHSVIQDNAVTIAATNAAFFSILIGYPFDSMKTRIQATGQQGVLNAIKNTFDTQGIRGFYRGVLPLLGSTTTLRAFSWNIYTYNSNTVKQYQLPVFLQAMIAGSGTGIVMSLFGAPMEFIKVQRQLTFGGSTKIPNNIFQWIAKIYLEKGFLGFYSGYSLHAPVDILGTGCYFGIYESIKYFGNKNNISLTYTSLIGGGLSGALSWIVVFPLDVIKSMYQKQALSSNRQSVWTLVKYRFNSMGITGFYRGLSMQMVRALPVHGVNFWVYERVLAWCKQDLY